MEPNLCIRTWARKNHISTLSGKNNPRAYSDFLTLLFDRGMLGWTVALEVPHNLGVFFVAKKDGKSASFLTLASATMLSRTPFLH